MASEKGSALPIIDRMTGQLRHIFNASLMVSKISRYIHALNSHTDGTNGTNKKQAKLIDIVLFIFTHKNRTIQDLFEMVVAAKQDNGEQPGGFLKTYTEAEVTTEGCTLGEITQQMIDSHLQSVICLDAQSEVTGVLDIKYLLRELTQ